MIEGLKRFRVQGSFLVLAAVGLSVVLSMVSAFRTWLATHRLGELGAFGHSLIGPINASLLVVAALVCAAWPPPAKRALSVTVTAALIATIGTLVQFGLGLCGQLWPPLPQPMISRVLDAIGFAVFTVIPAVATYVLWKMVAGLRREARASGTGRAARDEKSRRKERSASHQEHPATASVESAASDEPTVAVADPGQQSEPAWQPDPNAGAVWHSAGDAAAGDAASGWGIPGQSGGWIPGQEKHENPSRSLQGERAIAAPDASWTAGSGGAEAGESASGSRPIDGGRPLARPRESRAADPEQRLPETAVSQGERHRWQASASNDDQPEDATSLDLHGAQEPPSRWRPVRGSNGEGRPRS